MRTYSTRKRIDRRMGLYHAGLAFVRVQRTRK